MNDFSYEKMIHLNTYSSLNLYNLKMLLYFVLINHLNVIYSLLSFYCFCLLISYINITKVINIISIFKNSTHKVKTN
jgi:hypothetical protein